MPALGMTLRHDGLLRRLVVLGAFIGLPSAVGQPRQERDHLLRRVRCRTAMRGRYPMPGQDEYKVVGTPAPAGRHARASLADLLAFLGVLVLAGGLVLLADRTGQLSARLAFAGAAGVVAACVNAWRRLRRVELRRWRSGQVTYRGRRVTLFSAWGVEGQPPPTIEPPDTPPTITSSTPPTITSSTPPTITSSTPPTITSSTPPTITSSTPPTITSSTPPTVGPMRGCESCPGGS